MSDRTIDILKAVITALRADSALEAIVNNRIYSHKPQNSVFPNILISCVDEASDTMQYTGQSHIVSCQIFSEKKSPLEVLDIRSKIYTLLSRVSLTLDSGESVIPRVISSDYNVEDSDKTYSAIIQFEIETTE